MQKIRPSKIGSLASYTVVGLGFVSVDIITSFIDQQRRKDRTDAEQRLLQELNIQEPLRINYLRNFCYGFIGCNFNQILHVKFNQFLTQRKYSPNFKLIISPFAAIPYYFLAGFLEKKQPDILIQQLFDDLKILIPIRLLIDFGRINNFFFKNSNNQPPLVANKLLFLCFLGSKFINSSMLICLYDRKQIF